MKQQLILASGGILLLVSLYFFGKTVPEKTTSPQIQVHNSISFDVDSFIHVEKKKLSISQQAYIEGLESSISRGDVTDQEIKVYGELANFWKDSIGQKDLYIIYISKAASLVNSEKSLTFAARLILDNLREEPQSLKRKWKADQAIELFKKAIILDPGNEDLKVGLGSSYVFGKGMAGDVEETMKGIQLLLEVVRKDSMNLQAQLVLGIGGVISGQFEKATRRLEAVVNKQPSNVEAISWLADAYAGKGDKQNALKWYEISKRLVNNPQYDAEVNERIKMLQ